MANRFEVQELGPAHDGEVVSFLDGLAGQSPSVLAYQYPFFRDMQISLGVGRPWYLGLRRGEQLVALLPAFIAAAAVGVVFCSLPLLGPTAGVLCADGPECAEIHALLLGYLLRKAQEVRALSCSLYTPLLCRDYSLYDRLQPDAVVEKFTQYTALDNAVWNSKLQYDLRRAQHLGVTATCGLTPESLDAFYQVYNDGCAAMGIPVKPRKCVDQLVQPGVLGRHSHICLAVHQGEVVAGLLTVYSQAAATYYIPCTRNDSWSLQPGTVLLDKAIQDMRALGVRYWDWEGSPGRDSGTYRFKRKWNSVEASRRIYVWCPSGVKSLKRLGRDGVAAAFPGVFVYPFDSL